jgi:hypothetical protein
MIPLVAPAGTTAENPFGVLLVTVVARTRLKNTVAPSRFDPLKFTTVRPAYPDEGEKVATGVGRVTTKFEEDNPVFTGVVTLIKPVVAVAGTVVVMSVSPETVNTAFDPLNVTAVAPVKP